MKNDDFIPHDVGERDAFSLFQSLTTNKPSGLITLSEVYRRITTDASLKENTEKFRYFQSQGFKDDAGKIKRNRCPAFTPAVVFNGTRTYKNVSLFTGYSLVDIDKQTEEKVARMLERLKDDPYWLLAYITLSGKGLRIIFRVEGVTDRQTYLKAFHQGNDHYCRLFGITDYDGSVKDATRCSALSHDPNALYREEAKIFRVDYDKVAIGEVWNRVEQQLENQGYVYELGRCNEYLCHAGYALNR